MDGRRIAVCCHARVADRGLSLLKLRPRMVGQEPMLGRRGRRARRRTSRARAPRFPPLGGGAAGAAAREAAGSTATRAGAQRPVPRMTSLSDYLGLRRRGRACSASSGDVMRRAGTP